MTKGVCVQGYPQTYENNDWLFAQANRNDFVAGVVAWVDLENLADIHGIKSEAPNRFEK